MRNIKSTLNPWSEVLHWNFQIEKSDEEGGKAFQRFVFFRKKVLNPESSLSTISTAFTSSLEIHIGVERVKWGIKQDRTPQENYQKNNKTKNVYYIMETFIQICLENIFPFFTLPLDFQPRLHQWSSSHPTHFSANGHWKVLNVLRI